MLKYYKIISNIFKNYRFYSINVLFYELIFLIFYNHRYNKFKYLESDFLSDSIPCPFLFLKKIERFTYKNNVQNVCDLGSGFGKILYFFGKICRTKIDGVEIEKEIYNFSLTLQDNNIKIYNNDILKFNLKNNFYDAFILNDPLKNEKDLLELVLKIKKEYKKVYLIFINLDLNKQDLILKNLNVINVFKASNNKNIFFCKIS